MITCGYCEGPEGQIHYRMMGEGGAKPDLYCLHPAPFSGLAFTQIMPLLAKRRRVIAPDFPGHGGSHAFRANAEIGDYARAMLAVVGALSGNKPVDLFGFHTGCLVATEMSLLLPASIRRMVLFDVPAFDPEARANLLASNAAPPGFTTELSSLGAAWERGITRRVESQGMVRSFEMFVEQLRHGEAMNAGFHAGFTYPVEKRFAQVNADVTVLASQSGLLETTRRAAELIPNATLNERLDINRAVLDEAAPTTAQAVLEALIR